MKNLLILLGLALSLGLSPLVNNPLSANIAQTEHVGKYAEHPLSWWWWDNDRGNRGDRHHGDRHHGDHHGDRHHGDRHHGGGHHR